MTPYYSDEWVTLYHGDALELLPSLPIADLVVTDPPYMIGALSAGSLGSKTGTWADMMNSALWFAAWYRAAKVKPSGALWTFTNWRSLPVVQRAAYDAGRAVTSVAVWDKAWIGPGGSQGLRPSYELIALLAGADFAIPDRGIADILRVPTSSQKPTGHPAEKPVEVVQRVIEISGQPPGSLIVDPFIGSGTTAVASIRSGHRCIGVEADERWLEVAATRVGQRSLDLWGAAS